MQKKCVTLSKQKVNVTHAPFSVFTILVAGIPLPAPLTGNTDTVY